MVFRFLIANAILLFPAFAIAQVESGEVRSGDPQLTFPSVDELPEVTELPNPFVFLDGTAVKTREDWVRRQAEMKAMVLHYQFGHAPPLPLTDTIDAEILSETEVLDGQASGTARAVMTRACRIGRRSLTLLTSFSMKNRCRIRKCFTRSHGPIFLCTSPGRPRVDHRLTLSRSLDLGSQQRLMADS
ncbi:MAG: hypothetical protein WBH28_18115 [Fuerstiella sp.]